MEKIPNKTEDVGTLDSLKNFLSSWKFITPVALASLIGIVSSIENASDEEREAVNKAITEAIAGGYAEQIPTEKMDKLARSIKEFYKEQDSVVYEEYTVDDVRIGGQPAVSGRTEGQRMSIIINEADPEKPDRAYFVVPPELKAARPLKNRVSFVYYEGDNLTAVDRGDAINKNVESGKNYVAGMAFREAVFIQANDAQVMVSAEHFDLDTPDTDQTFRLTENQPNTVIHADHIAEMADHDLKLITEAIEKMKQEKAKLH